MKKKKQFKRMKRKTERKRGIYIWQKEIGILIGVRVKIN